MLPSNAYLHVFADRYFDPGACPLAAMVKRVANAKIACLDFSLQKAKMKMGVQVLIEDPTQLEKIRER